MNCRLKMNKFLNKIVSLLIKGSKYGNLVALIGIFIALGYLRGKGFELEEAKIMLSEQTGRNFFGGITMFMVYLYLRAWAWMLMGKQPVSLERFVSWFGNETLRFLPGGLWSWAGRGLKVKAEGRNGKASVGWELGLTLLAAGLVGSWWSGWLGMGAIIAIGFGYYKQKLKHLPGFIGLVISWICFGLAHYFWLGAENIHLVSGASLAWIVGLVSFVPLGLGVREGVLVWMMGKGILSLKYLMILRGVQILIEIGNMALLLVIQSGRAIFGQKKLIRWVLGISIVLYVVIFGYLASLRHMSFYSNFDLGNMDQTIWNTSRGSFFELTSGEQNVSRFSIHADLILVLLAPVYWIWPDVRALLWIQAMVVGLGAIPVFRLAAKAWKSELAALGLSMMYLINPWIQWTLMYDFHPVAFSMTFLLAAIYCIEVKNIKWYWIWATLALLTKEEIGLWLVSLGIMWMVRQRNIKQGVISIVIGLGWFGMMVFVVTPLFTPDKNFHWAWSWYQVEGSQEGNNINNIFSQIVNLNSWKEFVYYIQTLSEAWGYLPVLGLPLILMAWGDLGINFLSTHAQTRGLQLHYDSAIIPGLVLATIYGSKWLGKIIYKSVNRDMMRAWIYICVILGLMMAGRLSYLRGPTPLTPSHWKWMYAYGDEEIEFGRILAKIPRDKSVASSGNLRPQLTHREKAYVLPSMSQETDYVAILTQERIVGGVRDLDYELQLVNDLKNNQGYELIYQSGDYFLFKRK